MTITYPSSLISTRLSDVANAIDSGAGQGVCRLLDASNSVISSLPVGKPCATASGNLLTFNNVPWIDPATVGGTAVAARIETSNGDTVVSGLTVGTGSTAYDIVISPSNVLIAGETVEVTLATITGK